MPDKIFWDSNLWIYLFINSQNAEDLAKRKKLMSLLEPRPSLTSSVQVLNEVANVLMKKYGYNEMDTRGFLDQIHLLTNLLDLTRNITNSALALKARYGISWFDSLIAAAALSGDCGVLYSEDFQDGLVFEGKLQVVNPFKAGF